MTASSWWDTRPRSSAARPYLARIRFDGTVDWAGIDWTSAHLEEDQIGAFETVEIGPSGEFVALGYTSSRSHTDNKVYLVQVDAAGDVVRAKEHSPDAGPANGSGLVITAAGELIVTGTWVPSGEGMHLLLMKLGSDWEPAWARAHRWQDSYFNTGYVLHQEDDGFLIVGGTIPFFDSTAGIYLLRTDAMGERIWHKAPTGANDPRITDFAVSRQGGYVLTSKVTSALSATRFDTSGNAVSTVELGYGQFLGAIEAEDGGFVLVGSGFERKMTVLKIGPERPFLRGDANQDADLDIADPVFLLNWLFSGGRRPSCADAADMNDDGTLDISDAVYCLEIAFGGGPALGEPFSEVGMDPTPELI